MKETVGPTTHGGLQPDSIARPTTPPATNATPSRTRDTFSLYRELSRKRVVPHRFAMSLPLLALVVALAPAGQHASPEQHTRRIGIAGGVVFGLGVVAGATAVGLVPRRNHLGNRYADAASPAALGFPETPYADVRGIEREIIRLHLAIRVLTWTAVAVVVAGTTVLIIYGARHRRARNRIAWAHGLSFRF